MDYEYMYPPGLPRPDPNSEDGIKLKRQEDQMFAPGLSHESVSESSVIKSTEVASERFTQPSSSSSAKLSDKQIEPIKNGPARIENEHFIMEGIFKEDILQGPGKVVYKNANGSFEEGIYKNGLLHGVGKRYHGDIGQGHYAKSEEGQFEFNELHGLGKIIYYDGSEFEGVFEDGRPVEE